MKSLAALIDSHGGQQVGHWQESLGSPVRLKEPLQSDQVASGIKEKTKIDEHRMQVNVTSTHSRLFTSYVKEVQGGRSLKLVSWATGSPGAQVLLSFCSSLCTLSVFKVTS